MKNLYIQLRLVILFVLTIQITTFGQEICNNGIDGLAGGLALVGLLVMIPFFYSLGQYGFALLLAAISGALFSFLRFNLSKDKIFLGDGGSLFLGFVLAGIRLIECETVNTLAFQGYKVIGVASIFLLPVLDALRVFYGRMQKGNSPFKADKTHLHHLFLRLGMGLYKTTASIVAFDVFIILFAALTLSASNITMALLASGLLYVILTYVLTLIRQIKDWELRMLHFEKS